MGYGFERVDILLVDDNPGDARLVAEALKEGRMPTRLHMVPDGVEAIAFLRRQGRYTEAARPHVILLDLNLPRKDGREVLAEIKADPDLRRIPVVILTTSQSEQDIARSYDLQANCYVAKPVDYDGFNAVVRAVEEFWCGVARLPA